MFNPEKLIGGLIKGSLGGGHGMGTKAAIGLGLLGVAMEAIEHYSNQSRAPQTGALPPSPPGGQTPPPLPAGISSGPPVPPPASSATPPPPPGTPRPSGDAVLLIRSMIAAAYADGRLDENERSRIMEKLEAVGLDDEERRFILTELGTPADLDAIISAVNTPALAQQVYIASLLAIDVDTDVERAYLKDLAKRLYLSDAILQRIHGELGVALS